MSLDSTLKIIEEYKKYFHIKIISENDSGIYDAMNKGIDFATGEIVHILNSDDLYSSETILSEIIEIFKGDIALDMVYGDIRYFNQDIETLTRFWRAGRYEEKKLKNGWTIPHPSLFVRNVFYKRIAKKFDIRLSIAADYEFILRSLKIEKASVFYLPKPLVFMRTGGATSLNLTKGWVQKRRSWRLNNLSIPKFLIIKTLLGKVKQILVKFYR